MAGIGVDIVQLNRIERGIKQCGIAYLNRIFTQEEQEEGLQHPNPTAYYASRFASKEAVFKCLGIHWSDNMDWTQIRIQRAADGGLEAILSGEMESHWKHDKQAGITVSVSWDGNYSIAIAAVTASPA